MSPAADDVLATGTLRVAPPPRREWTPPTPSGHPGQMELPGCEPVEVGQIVAALVAYWAERYERAGFLDNRDFYLAPKRAGEQLLVSFGWRNLPAQEPSGAGH